MVKNLIPVIKVVRNTESILLNTKETGEKMGTGKIQLRSAGKGFVLVASNGLPLMRRLVDAYTSTDNKKYIKLDGRIHPLLPSHQFIPGS